MDFLEEAQTLTACLTMTTNSFGFKTMFKKLFEIFRHGYKIILSKSANINQY